jgi:hypothetical protein
VTGCPWPAGPGGAGGGGWGVRFVSREPHSGRVCL